MYKIEVFEYEVEPGVFLTGEIEGNNIHAGTKAKKYSKSEWERVRSKRIELAKKKLKEEYEKGEIQGGVSKDKKTIERVNVGDYAYYVKDGFLKTSGKVKSLKKETNEFEIELFRGGIIFLPTSSVKKLKEEYVNQLEFYGIKKKK